MEIRQVAFGSPEYEATVELRREVLRRPLGLDFTIEQLAAEDSDVHLALFDEDEGVVACLVLVGLEDGRVKMRQVAVREDRQGQGVGRQLVRAAETEAKGEGFLTIVLHARETAVPFYRALGYSIEGEPFEEVGIPHFAMSKEL